MVHYYLMAFIAYYQAPFFKPPVALALNYLTVWLFIPPKKMTQREKLHFPWTSLSATDVPLLQVRPLECVESEISSTVQSTQPGSA